MMIVDGFENKHEKKKKKNCNVFIIHPCKLNVGESKDIDFSCY